MNIKQRMYSGRKLLKKILKKTRTVKIYANCEGQYITDGDGIRVILE